MSTRLKYMRICHMTSVHTTGDVRIFRKECVSLAKASYEIYLVGRGESYEIDNIHIIGVGEIPNSRIKRFSEGVHKVYKKALELDCDVYHFHDPELLSCALKLKRHGKIVIFDSHENTVEQIKEKEWIPSAIRNPFYQFFDSYQRFVCKRIDAVISVTPHICDYFKGVNKNTFMIANYPIIQKMHFSGKKIPRSICFAGGIAAQWNHEKVIRAIASIEECRYVLCGKSEGNYLERLKGINGWEKVDYRGFLPHEEVLNVLASCQVGVSILSNNHNTAFKRGTMGNTKIFEEMMAGLPVICTDFELWKDFIGRYDCGMCVNPDDVDGIREAIQFLLDNPEEAKRMGDNGRRAVEQEFNWKTQEKVLLELYDNLMAGGGAIPEPQIYVILKIFYGHMPVAA